MKKILLIILCIFTSNTNLMAVAEDIPSPWPEVSPLRQEAIFYSDTIFAAAFYIFSSSGQPIYLIECHDYRYSESNTGDFDYSGDFECKLTPLRSTTSYSTLFTDQLNQSRDWQSRARFLSPELTGECAKYPDYGTVREFRFRGMKITLTLLDILFDDANNHKGLKGRKKLKSFHFIVNVIPDRSATSEIASLSAYLPPILDKNSGKINCGKVSKRSLG